MNDPVEISLTRKLRQLIELQEIELTLEEAKLYDLSSTDLLAMDLLTQEEE